MYRVSQRCSRRPPLLLAAVLVSLFFASVGSCPASGQCPGDCNRDNVVSVAEIIFGVDVTLGRVSLAMCEAIDTDLSGDVTIDEPVSAVRASLRGCPPTPTPTATFATATPTRTPAVATATPTVTPTRPAQNVAPVLVVDPPGDKTATLGTTLVFTVTASDANCPARAGDCDPGDAAVDPLSVTFAPVPLPRNASFNATSGRFSFRPDPDQVGEYTITFRASDGALADEETITITVPAPGDTTTLRGLVLTTGRAGLRNVRLVLGVQNPIETFTAADGSYRFENIPFAGKQRLLVDGSTVDPKLGTFATVPETITLLEGGDNFLDPPIFLLPLDVASADPVDPLQDSLITSSPVTKNGQTFPPIEMAIKAGSARMEDSGTMFEGMIHITSIPDPEFGPRPLPDDLGLSVYIAVQPFGVEYSTPADIAFPNVDGFPVGSIVDIFGLNHDTGVFEIVGQGRVENDGMVRSGFVDENDNFTRAGVVRNNSWHGFVPRAPQSMTDDSSDDPEDETDEPADWDGENVRVGMRSGNLERIVAISAHFSASFKFELKLEYSSTTAAVFPLISRFWTPGNLSPPPVSMSTKVVFGGQETSELFRDADFCSRFSCPLARFPVYVDANSFPTGEYPADYELTCNFTQTTFRSDTKRQNVQVVNQIESPFGAGWGIWGHEHVHRTATGKYMITNGTASADLFTPALQVLGEISQPGESDVYRIVGSFGQRVTVEMGRLTNVDDGTGSLDPFLELLGPAGLVIASDDDSGENTIGGPGGNAAIVSFPLPATGEYVIRARGAGGTHGPYRLLFTTATDTPLVAGVPSPTDVLPDVQFQGAIESLNQVNTHGFVANAGDMITVDVIGLAGKDGMRTLDPVVELVQMRDGDRVVLARDDDGGSNDPPGPGRNARISRFTLPNTGPYRLDVAGGGTGPYQVNVRFGAVNGGIVFEDGQVDVQPVVLGEPGDFSKLLVTDDGFERWLPNGTVKYFDTQGRLQREVQRNGNTTAYDYDGDLLTSITDVVGRVTRLDYEDGWLSRVVDPAGRETLFDHDRAGNLIAIQYPGGGEQRFEYDDRHLLTSSIGPRGFPTDYVYDFTGRLARSENPDGSTREVVSAQSGDGVPNPDPSTCGGGNPDLGCPDNLAPSITQSETEFVDGRRNRRSYDIDEGGLPEQIRLPEGITHTFEYLNRLPIAYTRPNGSVVRASWDDHGNLRRVVEEAIGAVTEIEYDGEFNEITRIVDARGNAIAFDYDDLGNLDTVLLPDGNRILFSYDEPSRNPSPARGLVTEAVWAAGTPEEATTIYVYDALGLLVRLESGGHVHRFAYDEAGNRVLVQAEGKTTRYAYNAQNVLVGVTHVGVLTGTVQASFELDLEANIIEFTDGAGRTTGIGYDPCNRPISTTDDQGNGEEFDYDEDGNVVLYENRNGVQIRFAWDALARLRQRIVGSFTRSYTYNSLNLLVGIVDPLSDLSFDYDALGRLLEVTTGGASQPEVTITYEYDLNGNRVRMTDPVGATTYRYDALNRLVGLTNPSGEIVDFAYDARRRLGAIEIPSLGLHRLFTYDLHNRVTRVMNALDDGNPANGIDRVFSLFDYDHDGHGNVVRLDQQRLAGGVPSALLYAYDEWSRLTRASGALPGSPDEIYGWDEAGNRTDAQVNSLNQVVENDAFTFEHDANGNLTRRVDKATKAATVYAYDSENRLTRVDRAGGGFVEYAYDGLGRRVRKNVDGVVRQYVYDGYDVLLEYDGADTLLARTTPGHCGSPLILERDADGDEAFQEDERFFFTGDALHSTMELVDHQGDVSSAYVYGAFGQEAGASGGGAAPRSVLLPGVENEMRYRGLVYEPTTGLYHHRGRDYDPVLGRFLQPKRFSGLLGAPKTLHPYTFAFNNPVSSPFIDLTRPGLHALLRRLAGGQDVALAMRRVGVATPFLTAAEDVDGEGLVGVVLEATRGTKECQPAVLLGRGSLLFEEDISLSLSLEIDVDVFARVLVVSGKPRRRGVDDGLLAGPNVLDRPIGGATGEGVGGTLTRDRGATVGGLLGEGAGSSNSPAPYTPF